MKTTQFTKTINISHFGLKANDEFILKSLAHIISGRNGINWEFSSSKKNIDIAIVNFDDTNDTQQLICSLKSRKIKMVLMYSKAPPPSEFYSEFQTICSPLRASSLLKCLDKIEILIHHENTKILSIKTNAAEKIPANMKWLMQNSNAASNKEKKDLSSLVQLLQKDDLQHLSSIDITLSSGWVARINDHIVNTSSAFIKFTGVYADPINVPEFQHWSFTSKELPLPPANKGDAIESIRLCDFFWPLTRLFKNLKQLNIDQEVPIRLAHWPDFSAYPAFTKNNGVLKATSLLINQPISCAKIMKKSGISEADLSCLIGACALSGLLEKDSNAERYKNQQIPENSRPYTGMLKSLRKLLGLKSGDISA